MPYNSTSRYFEEISNYCFCVISSREQHINNIEVIRVLLIAAKEYSQQSSQVGHYLPQSIGEDQGKFCNKRLE